MTARLARRSPVAARVRRGTDAGASLGVYMDSLGRTPLLTREEEFALAYALRRDGDLDAGRRLVASNLRFVVKLAMEYRRYGVPLQDLVQEGNLGLMHAVERFEPERGTRLLSYAVWWIRAYMQNCVLRTWSLVRLGTTHAQRRLFYKLPAATASLAARGAGGEPSSETVARHLDVEVSEIRWMRQRLAGRDVSLDGAADEDRRSPLDRLATEAPDPEEEAAEADDLRERRRLLERALGALTPREREIVEHRHLRDQPRTLQEIGRSMGLSRERVRQIENVALARLKEALARAA